MGVGCDFGGVGDVAWDELPGMVGDHKTESTCTVVLGTEVLRLFLDVLQPRLEFGSRFVGEGFGNGDGCRHDRRLGEWMDGWMDGWMNVTKSIATVNTSATYDTSIHIFINSHFLYRAFHTTCSTFVESYHFEFFIILTHSSK